MENKQKGFWEYFIEDAVKNPPYYTTGKITNIDKENNEVHITYTDASEVIRTAKLNVENVNGYSIGDILDIQICGGHFPAIFFKK